MFQITFCRRIKIDPPPVNDQRIGFRKIGTQGNGSDKPILNPKKFYGIALSI